MKDYKKMFDDVCGLVESISRERDYYKREHHTEHTCRLKFSDIISALQSENERLKKQRECNYFPDLDNKKYTLSDDTVIEIAANHFVRFAKLKADHKLADRVRELFDQRG